MDLCVSVGVPGCTVRAEMYPKNRMGSNKHDRRRASERSGRKSDGRTHMGIAVFPFPAIPPTPTSAHVKPREWCAFRAPEMEGLLGSQQKRLIQDTTTSRSRGYTAMARRFP
ncbi:hypothetical protein ACJBU6_08328 [Exserohilum turcicum]